MIGQAIANHRYVVIGKRDDDGHRWAIGATDDWSDAEDILSDGVTVDERHWTGVRIHDRRTQGILPEGGWGHDPAVKA
jgi:hypothetical protein